MKRQHKFTAKNKVKRDFQIEQYFALYKDFDKNNNSLAEIKDLLEGVKARVPRNKEEKYILDNRIYVYKIVIKEIELNEKVKKVKK